MSVTAPASPQAVRRDGFFVVTRARALERADAVSIVAVVIWTLVLAALTWGTWGDLRMDTGYDMLAASRTADGQLPYVDYTYWYGPLVPFALGGLFALTGASVGSAVAFGLLIAAAAVVLTYVLARTFTSAPGAALAAALVAPLAVSSANNSYVMPHAFSAPLGMVLALGAVVALVRGRLTRRALLVAGTLAALTALARPELALALYAGLGLWLAARVLRSPVGRRAALIEAATLLAPMIALPALVYGAFAASVGLEPLLTENLYPKAFVAAAGHVIIDAHAPWTPASIAKLIAHGLLYGAGLAALVAAGALLRRGGRLRTLVLAAAAGAALIFVAVVLVRPETVRYYLQYAYAWIPAGAWIMVGALLWGARDGLDRARETVLLPVLLLATITLTTYASFLPYPNAVAPEAAVYAMPIVAVVLVWLHVEVLGRRGAGMLGAGLLALLAVAGAWLAIRDARVETVTVSGPGGALTAAPADAGVLQEAVRFIDRETRVGEPVLLAPQLNALYTLADRPNALKQLSLLPGSFATARDEQDAIAHLGSVRVAVIDRTPLELYEHGAWGTTFDRRLDAAVRRDFRRVSTLSGTGQDALKLELWVRRN